MLTASQSKSVLGTCIRTCGYLWIPFHLSLHCPFQYALSQLHWCIPAAKHVSCLCRWQHWENCQLTLSHEGIQTSSAISWDHMSSSSSSSWEEPACWVALADAAAICACCAACCICSHSCWASSACCCRACSHGWGVTEPQEEKWKAYYDIRELF